MGYIKLDSYVSERTFSIICEFNMKKIENNPTIFLGSCIMKETLKLHVKDFDKQLLRQILSTCTCTNGNKLDGL